MERELETLQRPYREVGVDEGRVISILREVMDTSLSPLPSNFFCQLVPLPSSLSSRSSYLALSTDGVGTKLWLALQTGYFRHLGQDLVAMVYNDLITCGAQPLGFLDYYAAGVLEEGVYRGILSSIQEACLEVQMPLLGGETAQMPGFYPRGRLDLAGFGVGVVGEEELLGPHRVRKGDILVGFSSSGFHCNGFSLLRRYLSEGELYRSYTFGGRTRPLYRFLLEPAYLYRWVLEGREFLRPLALAHITGGGIYGNVVRVLPSSLQMRLDEEVIWSRSEAEIFLWFGRLAGLTRRQMLAIFNCGVGMVAVLREPREEDIARLGGFVLGEVI